MGSDYTTQQELLIDANIWLIIALGLDRPLRSLHTHSGRNASSYDIWAGSALFLSACRLDLP